MLRFARCTWGFGLALLLLTFPDVRPAQAQTTLAFQGFEGTTADDWAITSDLSGVSSDVGAGDTPAGQRIRTGSGSWQFNRIPDAFELGRASVSGFTDVRVVLHLSSTSSASNNAADGGDHVKVYVALDDAAFSATPDLTILGNTNARWGYSATTATTAAGTPATFQPDGGGDRTGGGDGYSTLVITIPDGTNEVALRVAGLNDRAEEFWNLDDVTLTGTPLTTETRVQFVRLSGEAAEGDAGTTSYDVEVSILNPDPDRATTATVAVAGGTATAGADYVFSGSAPDEKAVTFPAGSSASQTVTVAINGDMDAESGETIVFEVQRASGGNNAAAGSPSQFTLTLPNDDAPDLDAWINEFHYDNDSKDTLEFVEIAVPSSFTDHAGLELVRYEGGDGGVDGSLPGSALVQGATQGDFTLYVWDFPDPILENGGTGQSAVPDGLALCYDGALVVSGGTAQLLSYEGTFTATAGCATGVTSTDVGVAQGISTPAGSSLGLTGSGDDYGDLAWTAFDDPENGNGATNGTPNASQSLPVELVSFEAVANGSEAVLAWTTATERDNTGFHVEHRRLDSGDGPTSAFAALGFVEGRGTTSEPQRYAFRAAGLQPGRHVFRLRQVDRDGTSVYSEAVEVTVTPDLPGVYRLSAAYPNPFNPRTTFELEVARTQRVDVGLYDALGRRVAVLFEGAVEAGEVQKVEVDGSDLPSGLYLYRARGETFTATRPVTLLK